MHSTAFVQLLLDARRRALSSEPTMLTSWTPERTSAALDQAIADVQSQGRISAPHDLVVVFAPTGPLMELAMANEWVDEYMRLAAAFDTAIEDFR